MEMGLSKKFKKSWSRCDITPEPRSAHGLDSDKEYQRERWEELVNTSKEDLVRTVFELETEVLPAHSMETYGLRKILNRLWKDGVKIKRVTFIGKGIISTLYIHAQKMDEGGFFFHGDQLWVSRERDRVVSAVFVKDGKHRVDHPFRAAATEEYQEVVSEVEKMSGKPLKDWEDYKEVRIDNTRSAAVQR